jgi:ubiquinone/menaquinone biosynthesis C-methylase UbiE
VAFAEQESLRRVKEAELALRMPVSSNSADFLLPYYDLQFIHNVAGTKILDICGGGSDLTAALLSMGADAYALDIGYIDVRTHRKMLAEAAVPPNQNFIISQDGYPERYVGATATQIPFPDKSFDKVLSYYGIFGVMDEDYHFLFDSIEEALRILKDDGQLQVGPLMTGGITKEGKANQKILLDELRNRGDIVIKSDYSLSD